MKLYYVAILTLLGPGVATEDDRNLRGEPERRLQQLQYLDKDPNFLLQACQGDCDGVREACAPGLLCWQRDKETTPIPGCVGDLSR